MAPAALFQLVQAGYPVDLVFQLATRAINGVYNRTNRAMGSRDADPAFYPLLDALRREGGGAGPPTVYRALEFLVAHGLVHRIETLHAFVGCDHPGEQHAGQFLICRDCGVVREVGWRLTSVSLNNVVGEVHWRISKVEPR